MADQLFNDDTTNNPQATPEPQTPPATNPNDLFTDQLAAIKNSEGAPKYDTVEKAIEALQHSQQYIPELKDKVSSQEQLINDLQAKLEVTQSVQEIVSQQTPPTEVTPTSQPSLSEQDVEQLLVKKLQEQQQATIESTNQSTVNTALTNKYGANAQAEIASKAKELGMKPSELGALSKSNPAMVLALFGEKQTGNASPTTTSVNLSPGTPEIKPLTRPDKSVLSGATSAEQGEYMRKVKEEVYRKHGITQ
jgi:septum formation inhibitor MinC